MAVVDFTKIWYDCTMNTLWYTSAATDIGSALPLGNGRLGALVFGGATNEVIHLNEESVWSGPYHDRNNRAGATSIKDVQELISKGRIAEARALASEVLLGIPTESAVYQSAGTVQIDFLKNESSGSFASPFDYRRELDLETAIATTTFSTESSSPSTAYFSNNTSGSSITYTRETFVSATTNVLVVHVAASIPKSISFKVHFERGPWVSRKIALTEDTIVMEDTHGVPFVAMATALASGGKVYTRGEYLIVENADEATVYIDVQGAWRNKRYARKGGNVHRKADSLTTWCIDMALKNICFATGAPYSEIKAAHIAEYSHWYERASFSLFSGDGDAQETELAKLPTDELRACHSDSLEFATLYWNFCRYLFISSARAPGTLPVTTRGLWNTSVYNNSDCRYQLNGPLQMCYWPTHLCGLSECEDSLLQLLFRLYRRGKRTAYLMYGSRGSVAHHATDLWASSAPQGTDESEAYWLLGAAWLATHIRTHYEYTMDKKFLHKQFPVLKELCRFFCDFLISSPDGKTVFLSPSVSPYNFWQSFFGESVALCKGADMDNRILEHLFRATLQSAKDLNISSLDQDIANFSGILEKFEPPVQTADGLLREWISNEHPEPKTSRYISQLYALFPQECIDDEHSPELAQAARSTIFNRLKTVSDGTEGWQSWIINALVSLHETEQASLLLAEMFAAKTASNLCTTNGARTELCLQENFAALAAITRMIVQSSLIDSVVNITLLPALPVEWKHGSLRGVSLKGNIQADISWKNGTISGARLYTKADTKYVEDLLIRYQGKQYTARLSDGALDIMNVLPSTV